MGPGDREVKNQRRDTIVVGFCVTWVMGGGGWGYGDTLLRNKANDYVCKSLCYIPERPGIEGAPVSPAPRKY